MEVKETRNLRFSSDILHDSIWKVHSQMNGSWTDCDWINNQTRVNINSDQTTQIRYYTTPNKTMKRKKKNIKKEGCKSIKQRKIHLVAQVMKSVDYVVGPPWCYFSEDLLYLIESKIRLPCLVFFHSFALMCSGADAFFLWFYNQFQNNILRYGAQRLVLTNMARGNTLLH